MHKINVNIVGTVLLFAIASPAIAEVIPGTNLSVNFESAHIVGSGRHLNMQRVPVVDIDTGATTLFDVSFRFTLDPLDGLVFEQLTSAAVSPPIAVTNLVPGLYKSQEGICYVLEGPSAVDGNRSLYTFRGSSGSTCNNVVDTFTAQIVSGSATGHPDIGDREIVPQLKDSYVYGTVAGESYISYEINRNWDQNELIGLRQSGDQLIVGLFSENTDDSGTPIDFKDPKETAIFTRVTD